MVYLKLPLKYFNVEDAIQKAASELFLCESKQIIIYDELIKINDKCYLYNVIDNINVLLIEVNNPYKRDDYEKNRNDDTAMLDFKRR